MGTPWPVWAWAYWGGAGVVALVGVWALVLALWRDKGAKTRRCPRCWYEMTGVPGLKCPECGREAKSERALFRRRRSRWWAGAAVMLLVMAAGLGTWPKVERDGWWTVTPTTVLIWMWPEWVPDRVPPSPPILGSIPLVSQQFRASGPRQAILQRLSSDELWDWQKRWLGDKCLLVLRDSTDADDAGDSDLLLSRHLACSPRMRPLVVTLLAESVRPPVPIASTWGGTGPVLAALLEVLSADLPDGEDLLKAIGPADRTELIEAVLRKMAGRELSEAELSHLRKWVDLNPLMLPYPVIERIASGSDELTSTILVKGLDPNRLRPLSRRERRICGFLRWFGPTGAEHAVEMAASIDPLHPQGLDLEGRRRLVALFFMARSCPRLPEVLRVPPDEESWIALWARVLDAESRGDRGAVVAELCGAMKAGQTASVRLEAVRMVGLLDLGEERLVRGLEDVVRGESAFLSQYAVLSLVELAPRHEGARRAMSRLRAAENADLRQWIKNADTSMREVERERRR